MPTCQNLLQFSKHTITDLHDYLLYLWWVLPCETWTRSKLRSCKETNNYTLRISGRYLLPEACFVQNHFFKSRMRFNEIDSLNSSFLQQTSLNTRTSILCIGHKVMVLPNTLKIYNNIFHSYLLIVNIRFKFWFNSLITIEPYIIHKTEKFVFVQNPVIE